MLDLDAARSHAAPVREVTQQAAVRALSYSGAPTKRASRDRRPSAPTTTDARSVTGAPPVVRPRMPVIRSPSVVKSSTLKPRRRSTPASAAASTRIRSRDGAARSVAERHASDFEVRPDEWKIAEVDHRRGDGRAVRCADTVEQAPPRELPRPAAVNEVAVRNVARKCGAVDEHAPCSLVAPAASRSARPRSERRQQLRRALLTPSACRAAPQRRRPEARSKIRPLGGVSRRPLSSRQPNRCRISVESHAGEKTHARTVSTARRSPGGRRPAPPVRPRARAEPVFAGRSPASQHRFRCSTFAGWAASASPPSSTSARIVPRPRA